MATSLKQPTSLLSSVNPEKFSKMLFHAIWTNSQDDATREEREREPRAPEKIPDDEDSDSDSGWTN